MSINSASFQIVKVTTYNDIPENFPEHVCYYTQDTGKYYIWKNSLLQEVFTGLVQSITHAELVDLKTTNTLLPGAKYLITDFQTIYDQPDFDANGNEKAAIDITVKTSGVERIVVQAIDESTLLTRAESLDFPEDTIDYILEFTTPVTGTVTKGKIIKRIDERANETDFDHRTVLFKRYEDLTYNYGEFFQCFDNGGAYQEFLCIQPDQFTYSNRIGLTESQYQFDLPNFVLGIFGPGDDCYNNEFLSAPINTTVASYTRNNKIDNLANCTFSMLNTNVINSASNCFMYLNSGFGGNTIGNALNVTMPGGVMINCRIMDLINVTVAGPVNILDSNITAFRQVTSIAPVDIVSCNFNIFSNITMNDQCQFQYNNINHFNGNTFNKATLRNNLIFRECEFTDVDGCTFYGDFIYNKGKSISASTFKGHTVNNILTLVDRSEFGTGFGDINSTTNFNGSISNSLLGLVDDCTFGSNCIGNIISSNMYACTFGDYLMNNEFQDIGDTPVNKTTGPLFERQFSKVFFKPSIDTTIYSLGDALPLGETYPNYFFYRSEIINGTTYNFFAKRSGELAIWQNPLPLIPPNTQPTYNQLNTVDGLNNSMDNTRKLRSDLIAPFNGQLSLGVLLNFDLRVEPIGLIGYYPTLAELEVIYTNLTAMGMVITGKIWSSTEYDADTAYALDFDTGVWSAEPKDSQLGVVYIYEKRCNYDLKIKYDDFSGSEVIEDFV
jgi:hypothetical protein